MRKLLLLLLLCITWKCSVALDVRFCIYITDNERIVSYNSGVPVFDNQDINDIFDTYNISYFAKASPLSDYEHMRTVYMIICDSVGLGEQLVALDSNLFPEFWLLPEVTYLGRHIPSDWVTPHNDTDQFNFIKAPEAWDICKGDSNIIIGISDTWFLTAHEDMNNKYANVINNTYYTGRPESHGTFVAGLIAAKTGNGDTIGTTGVAYNCRLNVTVDYGLGELHKMAVIDTQKVKTRVLNASWESYRDPAYYFSNKSGQFLYEQDLCDEIYEKGVVLVAAAGNGMQDGYDPHLFLYPASYDHNLSISSVGHLFTTGDTIIKYMHEYYPGDSVSRIHQHNVRVDLCAPGYKNSSHYNQPFASKYYSKREFSGTSFAAPLVTGTVGLMLSKMPWLTPYQVEYVLKHSSDSIYHLIYNGQAHNQKYAGPTRFKGRLGAGSLNAGAALNLLNVDSFIANYPTTSTFRIKGIKLNTRCVPGSHAGVPNPRIEVIMENGTPPYKFKWERVNGVSGSPVNISPQYDSVGTTNSIFGAITSKTGVSSPWIFHYKLTVYDNSAIEKVASKVVYLTFTDSSIWDLVMQDSYADLYDEPNRMLTRSALDWDIWTSPDIWNRHAQDGDTIHQNPDTTAPNYMHVRIKNIGCVSSPNNFDSASVWLYWTLAKTGEIWPNDWIGTSPQINGHNVGDDINPGGTAIPAIAPGRDTILSHNWMPPKPQDYDTSGLLDTIHVCALARIQTSTTGPNFGMTFTEIDTTKVNVLKNNKIVTRNFVSLNLETGHTPTPKTTGVVVGNPGTIGSGTFTLQIITENQLHPYIAGHLASYMSMTIHLGGLYDVWDDGGKEGNPTSYDDELKTITWNMEQPLRLENITLDEEEQYYVILEFKLKAGLSIPFSVENQLVHFRQITPQIVDIDNGDGTTFEVTRDYVYSAVNYSINISEGEAEEKPGKRTKVGTLAQQTESLFELYPNPVNEQLTLTINDKKQSAYRVTVTDVLGKVIFKDEKVMFENGSFKINTRRFVPGTYYVNITDKTGNTQTKQFVKVE